MHEFGPEEDNLGRVINPNEKDHDRSRRPVCGLTDLGADVPTYGELTEVEQKRRSEGAWDHVIPGDLGIRKPFEQHGEQRR